MSLPILHRVIMLRCSYNRESRIMVLYALYDSIQIVVEIYTRVYLK